jgi:hypothetical protein
MAFLDNSGDIILDAVLTDAGRERLARGDGSFKITKFALGDDEINYELYNKNDSRGSAFYDLEVLQTPVLEAFTNNTSSMKSRLITITRNDVLYLPVLKIFSGDGGLALSTIVGLQGTIPVAANGTTSNTLISTAGLNNDQFYLAATGKDKAVEIDQGLDTDAVSYEVSIPTDLFETSYSVQIDNRLMTLMDGTGNPVDVSFVDDDQMAVYTVDYTGTDAQVSNIGTTDRQSSIAGPRGTRLTVGLQSTLDILNSDYLFTRLGGSLTSINGNTVDFSFIDTNLRITGVTTGYRIDIPIRLLRDNAS